MGGALQRLLARPSSLALLKRLVEAPSLEEGLRRPITCSCVQLRHSERRKHSVLAAALPTVESDLVEDDSNPFEQGTSRYPLVPIIRRPQQQRIAHGDARLPPARILHDGLTPTSWDQCLWNSEELEAQSDVGTKISEVQRLVDIDSYRGDMTLWSYLLDFRQRRYGDAGVVTIWQAMRSRQLDLPTEGPVADYLWTTFLDVGLKDTKLLSRICDYANALYERTGNGWSDLYVHVMRQLTLDGKRHFIVHWHDRLIQRHAPDAATFYMFIHDIATKVDGDLKALKDVYKRNEHRKAYANIVPVLLERRSFQFAWDWHRFLVSHDDYPSSQTLIEPLIHHFAIYDPPKAIALTKSLVSANVSFASSLVQEMEDNTKISREMMNLIHAEAFHIKPKDYNDSLGSRWFATRWVPIDVAISTIHALGVNAIGPLSLQAIALREGTPPGVAQKLDQLRAAGISIGNSVYAKAIEYFARHNEADFLTGLLASDQHPDTLDDRHLQESLLLSYERDGEWDNYHRTIAIQQIASQNPVAERYNIQLRKHVRKGDRIAVLQALEEMRDEAVPVTQLTIRYILRNILPSRRKGRLSHPTTAHLREIHSCIQILTAIMKCNGFVGVYSWREIIRRLGMLGRLDEVEQLCLWLAKWYCSDGALRAKVVGRTSGAVADGDLHLAPGRVPTRHHLHPLRMLFSDQMVRAIVEWAFKWPAFRPPPSSPLDSNANASGNEDLRLVSSTPATAPAFTRGISLLRQLREEGVYINDSILRQAVLNRLIILYGEGTSNVVSNRIARRWNTWTVDEMVEEVNRAWGAQVVPYGGFENVGMMIEREGRRRVDKAWMAKADASVKRDGQWLVGARGRDESDEY
jgi:hypothetical protein